MSAIGLEEERARYAKALVRVANALPNAFAQIPQVERVWLFGSYVRGRRDLCTDLDLIVIMRSKENIAARTARLYARLANLLEIDVDMDIVAYTPEEFAQVRERGFVKHALAQGRIIYERTN